MNTNRNHVELFKVVIDLESGYYSLYDKDRKGRWSQAMAHATKRELADYILETLRTWNLGR